MPSSGALIQLTLADWRLLSWAGVWSLCTQVRNPLNFVHFLKMNAPQFVFPHRKFDPSVDRFFGPNPLQKELPHFRKDSHRRIGTENITWRTLKHFWTLFCNISFFFAGAKLECIGSKTTERAGRRIFHSPKLREMWPSELHLDKHEGSVHLK